MAQVLDNTAISKIEQLLRELSSASAKRSTRCSRCKIVLLPLMTSKVARRKYYSILKKAS